MKKSKVALHLMVFLLLCILIPMQLTAGTGTDPVVKASTGTVESADINDLIVRLDEIKEMDKSAMSPSQKKDLRKEVREIKRVLKADSGGVYLSGAALILVVVLLILLLR